MALLKKINENWQPSEKPGLQVGEVLDFGGAYETLVKQGMAILVDEAGTELPLPTALECPICFTTVIGLYNFVEHVSEHSPARKAAEKSATEAIVAKMDEEAPKKAFKDMTDEEKKAFRVANLAKAREAKKKNG